MVPAVVALPPVAGQRDGRAGEGRCLASLSRKATDRSRALVYGAGPIGIGLWFALRGLGLTEIDVNEPSETRRKSIAALGARTLDPISQDVPALIAQQTSGRGVDAAYDAAGIDPAIESAPACLGERRTMVSTAIYDAPKVVPLIQLVLRERRIQGTLCYTAVDYRAVIDLMAKAPTTPPAGSTPSPSATSSRVGSKSSAPAGG